MKKNDDVRLVHKKWKRGRVEKTMSRVHPDFIDYILVRWDSGDASWHIPEDLEEDK